MSSVQSKGWLAHHGNTGALRIASHSVKLRGITTLFWALAVTLSTPSNVPNRVRKPEERGDSESEVLKRHPRCHCLPPPPQGFLAMSATIFGCHHWEKWELLMTNGQRPGMPLTTLQCARQPPPQRSASAQMSLVPKTGDTRSWAEQTRTELLRNLGFSPRENQGNLGELSLRYPTKAYLADSWHSILGSWLCQPGYSASAADLSSS